MDVSTILESQKSKNNSIQVEKDIPLEVDAGLLCVTDLNVIDQEDYNLNREEYLQSVTRDGAQVLLASLFSLPIQSSPDGPLGILPPPTTQLPRAKPLPKPKPPTKWERFANAKGIQHKKRDNKEWDEEKQEWVKRWGKGGRNKDVEEQWLTEVPANAEGDFDAAQVARKERHARVAKNEKQHQQNVDRASSSKKDRTRDIEKTLSTTRSSTASMGKFDKKLEGEKKLRGVKRKFEANEVSVESEKKQSLALLSKLGGPERKSKSGGKEGDVVNVRKAVKHASGGKGSHALARTSRKR